MGDRDPPLPRVLHGPPQPRPRPPALLSAGSFYAALSLSVTNAAAGPALVVSTVIARHPSATTIRKVWKDMDLLLTGSGNHTAYLGHTWRSQVEREHGLGVLL